MIASAVSTYINRFGVAPGRRAVVFTNNDSAYQTALDLHGAGIDVAAVVDIRGNTQGVLADQAKKAGIKIYHGHVISNVQGSRRVKRVEVHRLSGQELTGNRILIDCDLVA